MMSFLNDKPAYIGMQVIYVVQIYGFDGLQSRITSFFH